MSRLATISLAISLLAAAPASADTIRYCGKNAELTVSTVSDRTRSAGNLPAAVRRLKATMVWM